MDDMWMCETATGNGLGDVLQIQMAVETFLSHSNQMMN